MGGPTGTATDVPTDAAPGDPVQLDALGPRGPFRTRDRLTVADVTGRPVAELSQVPRLFVRRGLSALRAARPADPGALAEVIARAGHAFAHGTVGGLSAPGHQRLVSRVAGVPIAVVRSATARIERAAAEVERTVRGARPTATAGHWRDPLTRGGGAVWARRGDVFAVHAAGNHPGVHSLWLEALMLGYRVAVRPSGREPFTPHRLVTALREAGIGDDRLLLLPTDHHVADDIVRGADLSLVYGGDAVVEKYRAHPNVLTQGPGRSKILLADMGIGEGLVGAGGMASALDTVVSSIQDEAGVACVNATAVLVAGDPAPVAEAIAERLAHLPSLPPEDDKAVLPVCLTADARSLEKYLLGQADGARLHLGGEGIVDELGDGSAVLRPAVIQLDRPDASRLGVELPFPCVWVAPWTPEDGIGPLRNTLVLTVIGRDEQRVGQLVERLVDEPSISNVHVGDHPTHWMAPGVPHDGHLAEFLMRSKAVVR
ncbi:aldehyde dehydrogenase family protein [Streptomyces phaeolivaceus]|uniref:Aldehyde dehydrogenase family protein n=1 Tax=Streptomyces phaeolivaceus TaxID=2653200 RepID=A0A5P8KFX2_9ACTN|nr:aldehyde dehydrogenase family protein [Streptomyces phaeolivaceus]QFR02234.1 aldehyde dehydrogenase family protein [Streptomyces phaeolivaceus]